MTYRQILLASSALVSLSGPAFSQVIILNQSESGTPILNQSIGHTATATGSGVGFVSSTAAQSGTNLLNNFNGTNASSWSLLQTIGEVSTVSTATTAPLTGSVSQAISNTISATSSGALFASASANGSQVATNSQNAATVGVGASPGVLTQTIQTGSPAGGSANTQSAINVMIATANNGSATVTGSAGGGFAQAATNVLNAGTLNNATTSAVAVNQLITATVNSTATNDATAISSSPDATPGDPMVQHLLQSAIVTANTVGGTLETGATPRPLTLTGSQGLGPVIVIVGTGTSTNTASVEGRLVASLGNSAAATTGSGTMLGTGTSTVFDVGQTTALNVNTVQLTGSGAVGTGGIGSFTQDINGTTNLQPVVGSPLAAKGVAVGSLAATTVASAGVAAGVSIVLGNTVNSAVAGTGSGGASVSAIVQTFTTAINDLTVSPGATTAGSLSGSVGQTATNINIGGRDTYANVAVAYSGGNGGAAVGGAGVPVTQTMTSSVNTAGAGSASSLGLSQTIGAVVSQLDNVMVAAGRTASVGPGSQTLTNNANVASFGTYSGTTVINQSSFGSNQVLTNRAAASSTGGTATISGLTQTSTNSTNVMK